MRKDRSGSAKSALWTLGVNTFEMMCSFAHPRDVHLVGDIHVDTHRARVSHSFFFGGMASVGISWDKSLTKRFLSDSTSQIFAVFVTRGGRLLTDRGPWSVIFSKLDSYLFIGRRIVTKLIKSSYTEYKTRLLQQHKAHMTRRRVS